MTERRGDTLASRQDPYIAYADEIAKENVYLLKWLSVSASINMSILSFVAPMFSGFSDSVWLYVVAAFASLGVAGLSFLYLPTRPRLVSAAFYAMLIGMCAYSVALSSFIYPKIHGVTIVAIFVLIPVVILDRSIRVNLMVVGMFAVSTALAFVKKPAALAVDDTMTVGCFALFGMMIGVYMRGARLGAIEARAQLTLQRDMDELTGLPNRRKLFADFSDAESGEVRGIVMMDVDEFKAYNDRCGHLAGDDCLRALGRIFAEAARERGATIYRYGGEEFLAICREGGATPRELADGMVETVRSRAEDIGGVTMSAGWALCEPDEPLDANELIRWADRALYRAKNEGRDRSVGYDRATDCR